MESVLRVPVGVGRGQFGNLGSVTSTVGSQYQRTDVGLQTENTTCVCSEM
jgi:hypothetical protein